jgi:hypothetical protein
LSLIIAALLEVRSGWLVLIWGVIWVFRTKAYAANYITINMIIDASFTKINIQVSLAF